MAKELIVDSFPTAPPDNTAGLLLSLPTLAQAAFGVIVAAFAGIMAAGLLGDAPVRMAPILLSLLLLPARAVLARPERTRRDEEDAAATAALRASGELARIEVHVAELGAAAYGLRPVGIIVLRQEIGARIVGAWRRNYLALGSNTARQIAAELNKPAPAEWVRALLLHELAHVAAHDSQRVGLAEELLRGAFTILPWWIFFLAFWIGMGLQGLAAALAFDFAAVPGMPPGVAELANGLIALDPSVEAEMVRRAAEVSFPNLMIFVVLSLWPIALTSGILYLFFWRWMLRVQEHYADLRAMRQGVSATALDKAQGQLFAFSQQQQPLWWRAWSQFTGRLRALWPRPLDRLRRWFAAHPTRAERQAILAAPERVYADWQRVAWSTAVLSVGLDVIFASPLFLYHTISVHLYPLTALMLLSTWLLPQLILGQPIRRPLLRVMLLLVSIRAIWLALNSALLVMQVFLFPNAALELLNSIVIAGARYSRALADMPFTDPTEALGSLVGAVGLEALELAGLAVALALYVAAQRRNPAAAARRHWPLVAGVAVAVYAVMLLLSRF